MANVARIKIEGTVPFDWLTELTEEEAKVFSSWLLSPSTDLRMNYKDVGFVPNEHGGRTSMYQVTIEGTEAIWPSTVEIFTNCIKRVGTLISDNFTDLEG